MARFALYLNIFWNTIFIQIIKQLLLRAENVVYQLIYRYCEIYI